MKQFICILTLLLAGINPTKAQNNPVQSPNIPITSSIRGKVLTEKKQPLEFANITLLSPDSTFTQGKCSHSDGSFEIVPPDS